MVFPHIAFVLEVIGACLLLVMIVYAVQLNRRLTRLQADKVQLQQLITSFNQSTERAEASVLKLRAGATETAETLQVSMTKAKQLRDDLTFMVDRAGSLADRLESSIGTGRAQAKPRSVRPAAETVAAVHAATTNTRTANTRTANTRTANTRTASKQTASEQPRDRSTILRALAGIR